MKKTMNNKPKTERKLMTRIASFVLSLVMVAVGIPLSVWPTIQKVNAAPTETDYVADPHTLNGWMRLFGQKDDGSLSTEFAGGVWTDKSVFNVAYNELPDELKNATYNGRPLSFTPNGDNFLVALSAMAANKEITGYETIPTDTVLVLDMSTSMQNSGYVDDLAIAANAAIKKLLEVNHNNRVSVVLYSGANEAYTPTTVLMPLDRYESRTDREGDFIQFEDGGYNGDDGISIVEGVYGSDGRQISGSRDVGSATYTQDGIYVGMNQLLEADSTVEGGVQAGAERMPIMVLMSDGEPNFFSTDYAEGQLYDGRNEDDLYHLDCTQAFYGNADVDFMVQLTGAYTKYKIEQKYQDHDMLFYTIGLGNTGNVGPAVLDPESNTSTDSYWEQYLDDTRYEDLTLTYRRQNGTGNFTITTSDTIRAPFVSAVKSTDADDLRASGINKYRYYVDEYYPSSGDNFVSVFDAIVDEILVQSKYYPTYIEHNDYNHDGYLTFADKLGAYMDIVDVKGIVVGDRLFSGAALAAVFTNDSTATDFFGTEENASEFGDELVRSVKARLHIENLATARALISSAYTYGQLSYTSDSDYSHYIGWFSNADGEYVDFWHEGMSDADINAAVAKGATHIVKSYGFLGSSTGVVGVSPTDMMYMSVKVAKEIATGDVTLTWKIPASLIPTLTYNVGVEIDGADGNVIAVTGVSIEDDSISPMRLLYEVALREDITDWNIAEKVSDSYVNSTENKLPGYTFYASEWCADAEHTTGNTYSHFVPSKENERYYYSADALVYEDESGTLYESGAAPADKVSGDIYKTGYYRLYYVYEKSATGAYSRKAVYEPITDESLAKAEEYNNTNQWIVPKGTVFRVLDGENTPKASNPTETMQYVDNPFVVSDAGDYYTYSTQGNNGRFSVTPATGIKLTKTLGTRVTGASDSFTFTVTAASASASLANAVVIRLDENGDEASRTALAADGKVTLSANETVYIIGLTAGDYSVSEGYHTQYSLSSLTVDGNAMANGEVFAVTAENINSVDFVNNPKGYGSLNVGKDVVYPDGFIPSAAHNDKEFVIDVTFTGLADDLRQIAIGTGDSALVTSTSEITGTDPSSSVTYRIVLKDSTDVLFANIPENITYVVEEKGISNGNDIIALADQSYSGSVTYYNEAKTITSETTDHAQVVNTYAPTPVTVPNVTVTGTKTVHDEWSFDKSFTIELVQVDDMNDDTPTVIGSYEVERNEADYTASVPYSFDLAALTADSQSAFEGFAKAGMYYFRIREHIPAGTAEDPRIENMVYDRSVGLFTVEVGDRDADGKLEIVNVTATSGDVTATEPATAGGNYTVSKSFVNHKSADLVTIPVQKIITGENVPTGYYANLRFGLFTSTGDTSSAYSALTDTSGLANISFAVTEEMIKAAPNETLRFYLREIAPALENRDVGMTYNEEWQYAIDITWGHGEAVVKYAAYKADGNYADSDWTTVDPTIATPQLSVTNTYDPTVVSTPDVILSGIKELQKPENSSLTLKKGDFTFKIYQTDANFVVATNATPLQSVTNGAEEGSAIESIKFAPITFKAEGVYYLVIEEEHRGETKDGVTYDLTRYAVTVTVKKAIGEGGKTVLELDGAPVIRKFGSDAAVPATDINFTNTYTVTVPQDLENNPLTVGGTKVLIGRDLSAVEFTFSLVEVDSNGNALTGANAFSLTAGNGVASTTDKGKATFAFPSIPYTQDDLGVHYYKITEVNTRSSGVKYDERVYFVVVTVGDDGAGKLTIDVETHLCGSVSEISTATKVDSITFTNTYTPDPVSTYIVGNKIFRNEFFEVIGLDAEKFSFTLVETDSSFEPLTSGGLNQTLKNDASGSFTSDEIKFTEAGVRYFVIKEVVPTGDHNGIVYDTTEYRVTVTATYDTRLGRLSVSSSIEALTEDPQNAGQMISISVSNVRFNNTYVTADGELTLEGQKWYDGVAPEAGKFSFEIYNSNDQWAELTQIGTAVSNDAAGKFVFPKFTYTDAEIGVHYYLVKEVNGGSTIEGITYDDTVYRIKVTVRDNGLGQIVAEKEITTEGSAAILTDIVFNNAYGAEGNVTVNLNGNKTFIGSEVAKPDFTFELYSANSEYQITNPTPITRTVKSGAFGFVLGYTEANVGQTYYYVIKEANGGQTINGTLYDDIEYHIAVTVGDDGKGVTTVSVVANGLTVSGNDTVEATVSGINFTNTYSADADTLVIEGQKWYNGVAPEAGKFSFELYESDAQWAEGDMIGEAVKNDATGKFVFPTLTYTDAEIGTHYYLVKETNGGQRIEGINYDGTVYRVEVTVIDNGLGQIEATQTVYIGTDVETAIVFNNTYTVDGDVTVNLNGDKFFSGSTVASPEFTFELYKTDITYAVTGSPEYTDSVVGSGDLGFVLNYTEADVGNTYYYVIKEKNGGQQIDGTEYDSTEYRIAVTVGHDGKGVTVATVVASELVVSNDGTAAVTVDGVDFTNTYSASTGPLVIEGQKWYDGVAPEAGKFSFELYKSNAQWAELAQIGEAVKNDATGKFVFPELTYEYADIGTHYYLIKEVNGGNRIDGINHDGKVYRVEVTVVDNGIGQIKATAKFFIEDLEIHTGVVFRNTYTVEGDVSVKFEGNKVFTGSEVASPEFTFELYKTDSTYAVTGSPEDTDSVVKSGTFGFVLNYTEADVGNTYYYVIREKNGGQKINGTQYDNAEYRIAVTVGHDKGVTIVSVVAAGLDVNYNTGATEATVSGIDFTNTYSTTADSVVIEGQKWYDGAAPEANKFSFELYESNAQWAEGDRIGEAVKNDATGKFVFPELTYGYDKIGTHYYLVKEVNGGDKIEGITHDGTVYQVEVTVADNGVGQIEATQRILVEKVQVHTGIVFNNTYSVEGNASVTLEGNKTFLGSTVAAPDFTFELYRTENTYTVTGDPIDTETVKSGAFEFVLGYTQQALNNTYYYVIREANGGQEIDGTEYDSAEYRVAVTVGDNGKGATIVSVVTSSGLTVSDNGTADVTVDGVDFVNTYSTTAGSLVIEGQKWYDGVAPEANKFSFELYESDAQWTEGDRIGEAVKNDATGKFAFPTLMYNYEDIGTYYYLVKEVNGGQRLEGINYDGTVYRVEVTVRDNGLGQIVADEEITTATSSGTLSDIVFSNAYTVEGSASVKLEGNKVFTGSTVAAPDFTFEIYRTDDTYTVTDDPIDTETVKSGAFGFVLNYTEADRGNTYYYVIKEVNGGQKIDGTQYDSTEYRVAVTVGDDGKGVTTVSVVANGLTVSGNDTVEATVSGINFTNTYSADADTLVIEGQKWYNGVAPEAGKFSFELYESNAQWAQLAQLGEAVKNDGTGKFVFPTFTYDYDDIGTHYYLVKETNGGQRIEGVNYDGTVYRVEVTVIDNGNGEIEATQTVYIGTDAETAIVFNNTYTTDADTLDIEGQKWYNEVAPEAGKFSFELYESDAQWAEGDMIGEAVKNDATGKFVFPTLTYTDAEIGTHYYLVKETNGGDRIDGIVHDDTVYRVKVTVIDNGKGEIVATATVYVGDAVRTNIVFNNTYKVLGNVTVQLNGNKTFIGSEVAKPDFVFELYKTDSTYTVTGEPIDTKTLTSGAFAFILNYTEADVGETYYYVVTEKNGGQNIDGTEYDARQYRIKVTVGHMNGDVVLDIEAQNLTVSLDGTNVKVDGIDFTNKYTTTPATYTLTATKTYGGKKMKEFTFILSGEGIVTQEKKNGEDGKIVFDALVFDEAGSYEFTVSEKKELLGFIKYDTTVYTVKFNVIDNGKGALVVSNVLVNDESDASITFHNEYILEDGTAQIIAEKKYIGKELTAGEFEFDLYMTGEDYSTEGLTPVYTATNGADGKIVISGSDVPALTYDEEGVYYYVLKESADDPKEYVKYDSTVYTFKVTVTDNEEGKLVPTVVCTSGQEAVVFTNTYEPPIEDIPQTGDYVSGYMIMLLISAAGIIWVLGSERRSAKASR